MKFPFSMWNYNRFEDFGHVGDVDMDELAVWNRCGLTVPCLPRISCKDTDPALLVPLLDRAGSLGMKLIACHIIKQSDRHFGYNGFELPYGG